MRAERMSLSSARRDHGALASVPVVSSSCTTSQAIPSSSRLGPTMPSVISGRRARERSRSTSVSSTACALGYRFSGSTCRQRSTISASRRSIPGRERRPSGLGLARIRCAIDGQLRLQRGSRPDRLFDLRRAIGGFAAQHVVQAARRARRRPTAHRERPAGRPAPAPCRRRVPSAGFCSFDNRDWPKSHKPRLEIVVEQHVGRLQVAVQDAAAVRVDQGQKHALGDPHGLVRRQRAGRQKRGERTVGQVLHHVIRRLAVPADVDQADDVPRRVEDGQLFDLAVQQATSRDRGDGCRT